MAAAGVSADDDDAVFASRCCQHQCCAQTFDAATFNQGFIDHVAAITANRHDDFFGVVALLFRVGQRQLDLQLCEFAVSGRQHQKNQHHQQHINERNQVDLRLVPGAFSKIHGLRIWLRWRKNRSDANSIVSR